MRWSWILSVFVLTGCPGDAPVVRDAGQAGDRMVTIVDGARDHAAGPDETVKAPDGKPGQPDIQPPPDAKPLPPADVQPWPHDIGKSCATNADCMYKLCATNTHTGTKFCTKTCNPCTANPCPAGSGCQNAGMAYICAPGYPNAPCPP